MDGIVDTASAPNFAERVMTGRARILTELRKCIVGQDEVVDQVLIALFTGGHCLITGVPGLAKTLLISQLACIFAPAMIMKTTEAVVARPTPSAPPRVNSPMWTEMSGMMKPNISAFMSE